MRSSTHPGGGVSSACGANAAREILLDLKRPNTVPEDDFTMNSDLLVNKNPVNSVDKD